MHDYKRLLLQAQHFSAQSTHVQDKVLEAMHVRIFDEGQAVVRVGEHPEAAWALLRGRVEVLDLSERLTHLISVPHFFGIASLLDKLPSFGTIVTRERSVFGVIPQPEFERLVQDASVLHYFATLQCHLLRAVLEALQGCRTRRLRDQVGMMLLRIAGYNESSQVEATQEDIARLVDASRQAVNGALGELRAEGFIATEPKRIILLDTEGLAASLAAA